MADISKITPPGSQTTYNLKDATAREQALIAADQTTQYNVANIYNAVASGMTVSVSGYTATFSGTGSGTIEWGSFTASVTNYKLKYNINSAGLSFNIRDMTTGTQVQEYYVTSGDAIANLTLTVGHQYAICTYSNSAVSGEIKISIIPTDIYDAGFTDYQPYALPNTKITPELIELVDSGAKNELELITPYGSGITNNPNLTVTLNSDQTITVNGSATTSGAIVISNTISGKLGKYLSGRPSGVTADIRLTAYTQPSWSAVGNDYNGEGATITDNGNIIISIYVIAGQTYSNLTLKPMICSKSAWDVSQKYVPYRPTYEETVEQVAENENNILSKQDKPTASSDRYNTTDTYANYVTLTIPANRVCKVSAALSYSNSQPRGIAISQSNDSSTFDTNANLIGQKVETSSAVPQLLAEGYCSFSTEKTLYVWAKSASAASNSIFASVEYLS